MLALLLRANLRSAILIAAVFAVTVPAHATGPMRAEISKRFPGWKPVFATPYCGKDSQRWSVAGDFDADGRADRLVKIRHGARGHYVVLFNRAAGWSAMVVMSVTGTPEDPLLIASRGEEFRYWRGGNLGEMVGPRRRLDRDAPVIGACESGGLNAWRWDGARFASIMIGLDRE